MEYFYLASAIVWLTALGINYKLSDRLGCNKRQVNLFMFLAGAVVTLIWGYITAGLIPIKTVVIIGITLGVITFFSVAAFREAIARGRISTSWTILQLSLVVPVIGSVLIWEEVPHIRHYAGFALTALAIVLLGIDMGRAKE
ncbi:MAG: hypothetical protein Q7N50_12125 [Armatimonadota bacterium]|nr:hypothetical protein [Armatimonadota bacterium]